MKTRSSIELHLFDFRTAGLDFQGKATIMQDSRDSILVTCTHWNRLIQPTMASYTLLITNSFTSPLLEKVSDYLQGPSDYLQILEHFYRGNHIRKNTTHLVYISHAQLYLLEQL